ncbi:MAG: hypothetical protein M9965_17435 [Anaerolineae bacterium]|nr:hypothetical protein [Anaerolineae bacterium]
MSEIVSKCDVCGSQHLKKFVDWKTNNTVLSYVICTSCGLVFLSPRPSSHDLENYYLADYRVEQQGTELPTDQKVDFERRRTIHLLQVIESHIPVIDVHLDIGCAAGELIIAVKKLYGCTSYGIEPSIAYRTYLDTELGIPTFPTLPDYIQSTTLKRKSWIWCL